jgi:hypothetical protein
VGGNRSAQRKPKTFCSALTDSFHIESTHEFISRIEPTVEIKAVKAKLFNYWAVLFYQFYIEKTCSVRYISVGT